MAGALVLTEELSKTYGEGPHAVAALVGVSVAIEAGEFVAVMGPSGSGKSTFMNLLGCLDRPTAGRMSLAGRDPESLGSDARAALRNRTLGFVFQQFNLLPRLSARANVELPMVYAGTAPEARRRRALDLLGEVGLADRPDARPTQLSGGQQQRVALARALANRPALILADEPTGALDTRTGLEIMALLQGLNRAGQTLVMVTHDAEVAAFAGRVLRFRDGRLRGDDRQAPVSAADRLAALREAAP